jgi:cation diffusion facilitator CzcD-associated flavoprotein CzcO
MGSFQQQLKENELNDFDAVVIGAGFSGMYMLHLLREAGFSAKAYEAGGGVGGVWYFNRYPGLICDSDSVTFNYTFSEELYKGWTWSRRYPNQPEVLRYLNYVADTLDLRKDIQFNTRITSAHFDEQSKRWKITTDDGSSVTAKYFITGLGTLSASNVPKIKGLESFEGEWHHTGRWPDEQVDFKGKKVGVIGTGSSGIQVIPKIANEADHLTVFQRTAQYSIPARNKPLDQEYERQIKADLKKYIHQMRYESPTGNLWEYNDRSALADTPDERQQVYERLWEKGGPEFAWGSYNDLNTNPEANETASEFVRNKIRETVKDAEIAEKLIPDYPLGGKRVVLDTGYFETYNRENVKLVDVKQDPIIEITPKGIKTEEAEHELDMIVFATGYDALTGPLLKMDIRGKDAITLKEKWQGGANLKTYLGLANSGFPNMFTITGPQGPGIHGNVPVIIEQNVEWISQCIQYLRDNGVETIEATIEAEEGWTEHTNEIASKIFYSNYDSWYTGANIEGKPRTVLSYRGGLQLYREKCDQVAENGYKGFTLKASVSTLK